MPAPASICAPGDLLHICQCSLPLSLQHPFGKKSMPGLCIRCRASRSAQEQLPHPTHTSSHKLVGASSLMLWQLQCCCAWQSKPRYCSPNQRGSLMCILSNWPPSCSRCTSPSRRHCSCGHACTTPIACLGFRAIHRDLRQLSQCSTLQHCSQPKQA